MTDACTPIVVQVLPTPQPVVQAVQQSPVQQTIVQEAVVVAPAAAPILVEQPDINELDQSPSVTEVVTVYRGPPGEKGDKGDKGDKGEPGGSISPISFSYGDAPSAVYTFDASGVISEVRVAIRTPFDGVSPSIKCGVSLNDESYMPAAFNDPAQVADFDNTPDIHVLATSPFWLTVTPGAGATQGSGTVLITFLPD